MPATDSNMVAAPPGGKFLDTSKTTFDQSPPLPTGRRTTSAADDEQLPLLVSRLRNRQVQAVAKVSGIAPSSNNWIYANPTWAQPIYNFRPEQALAGVPPPAA